MIVFAYILSKCGDVFNQEYTVQTSFTKTDLTTDPTTLNLTRDKFDFGIKILYLDDNSDPNILNNLDDYVQLFVTQNNYEWV